MVVPARSSKQGKLRVVRSAGIIAPVATEWTEVVKIDRIGITRNRS